MPFAVSSEQRKYFRDHQTITFEEVITPDERRLLAGEVRFDQLKVLNRRRQLAQIAFQLTDKKPWRLVSFGETHEPLREEDIGIVIDLETGHLIYFRNETPALPAQRRLMILTTRYLNEERHPILYR